MMTPPPPTEVSMLVMSTSGTVYAVDLERGTCSCLSFTFRHRMCKHMRAVSEYNRQQKGKAA